MPDKQFLGHRLEILTAVTDNVIIPHKSVIHTCKIAVRCNALTSVGTAPFRLIHEKLGVHQITHVT